MIIQENKSESKQMSFNTKLFYKNYVYIPIPKNAHRLTTQILFYYNFTEHESTNILDLQNKLKIIVLRDPLQRWYSGVCQYIKSYTRDLIINSDIVNLLTSITLFDIHTRTQTSYLSGIDTDECVFFNLDDKFYENRITYFCDKQFNKTLSKPGWYGKNTKSLHSEMNEAIKKYMTKEFENRIIEFYKDDYELYNSVKFFRGNSVIKINYNQRKSLLN